MEFMLCLLEGAGSTFSLEVSNEMSVMILFIKQTTHRAGKQGSLIN